MMEIVWTENAIESFCKVVDFLFDDWSMETIESFEIKTDKIIEKVASFDQICPESKLLNYRKCVIDHQNSMIYCIINNKLIIVNFIDNRSQHSY